jgi:DNA-binding response OmpR family regulator
MVSLRRLRVAVATPDPELAARTVLAATEAGHEVAVVTEDPVDAMEAAFSRAVDVLVLDQELHRLSGVEIASVVRSVGTAVSVVVLHRGELATADDLLVLDPTRPGFEAALANVLDRLQRPAGAPTGPTAV